VNHLLLKMYCRYQCLICSEDAQDMVEYALLVSLVALAAITGIGKVATAVTNVFTRVSTSLA